ncbi:hypothetical protein [Halobacterium litoreum]|uniref:DUF8123 domain-containing protein n=1 Tax=Halobacterium litoreum TaxID=2039234 RepID=A0ABD5NF83_9EURY|nr:hypothetical protein [Halobacterium litoreum]UHH13131.1 hypothetical protein LT972_13340 [Halobacterium litoreum]
MQQVFADRLDVFGVLVGVFVALVGVGTLVGMPWQYSGGGLVTVLQIFGSVVAVGVGVGLAWLTHTQ